MKRIVLLIITVFLAWQSTAQDIIVTKSQSQINAKILEITDTAVTYSKQNSPTDQTFKMSKTEIVAIIFANGDVYTIQNGSEVTNSDLGESQVVPEAPPQWVDTINEEYPIVLRATGKRILYRTGTHIDKNGGKIYYGNTIISENDCIGLLQEICPEAYLEYRKGVKYDKIDTYFSILALSLAFYVVHELRMMYINTEGDHSVFMRHFKHDMIASGGLLLTLPFFVTFQKKEKQHKAEALRIFNQDCAWSPSKETQPQLSFYISKSNVGLTINF